MRIRPQLAGLCRRVDQHRVGSNARSAGDRGAIESVVERIVRLIAEREAAQRAVARDGVRTPFDPVANVVKPAGEWLADAGAVIAMSGPACGPGDQGAAQQAL